MPKFALALTCAVSFAALMPPYSVAYASEASPTPPQEQRNTPNIQAEAPALAYQIEEGRNLNAFYRQGPVAAHLVLRSGFDPRIIVAFPAGNSGSGVWFDKLPQQARWRIDTAPKPTSRSNENGLPLHGIISSVSIDAPAITPRGASLSSIRVLRDYELTGKQPDAVSTDMTISDNIMLWQRERLDGAPGYVIELAVTNGRIKGKQIVAGKDGRIGLTITALTGEKPLTPLASMELLNDKAGTDETARNTLEFLSYDEKFLAGSWRFDTYFGRDTLMSLRLLMPALTPRAVEAGLGSVLARISPEGEVAHEEDIGEFAILRHRELDGSNSDAAVYDYKMIDETPMLASVAEVWLLDDPRGAASAKAFLARPAAHGLANGEALLQTLLKIAADAEPFALQPTAANLIAIKAGQNVGNWRDSQEGLAWGKYPYDVNAVHIPAALRAAGRLEASGLLDPWLDSASRAKLQRAGAMARIWEAKAPGFFDVALPRAEAERAIQTQSQSLGISPAKALAALPDGALHFPALSLDKAGQPIPVVQSDPAFALLLSEPSPAALEQMVKAMMRPYPAGLVTEAGLLVANPTFASHDVQKLLTPQAYHGEVVWPWHHAMLVAGLERQLGRDGLPEKTRTILMGAHEELRRLIATTNQFRNSELWSWEVQDGEIAPAAFGASDKDADESNAAQLWSTVFLALPSTAPAPD